MSAVLRPPQAATVRGRGRGLGRGGEQSRGRGRGRGRGSGGASLGQRHQPLGNVIPIGVIINYGDRSSRPCRLKWPVGISEEQAIVEVLKHLNDDDLQMIAEIHISQAPRGEFRISWLDDEPYGAYYFNQHLYGENGTMTHLNLGLNSTGSLEYSPDDLGYYNQDNIAGYSVSGGHSQGADRVGPVAPTYNPDDVYQSRQQQQQPRHPAFLTRRI